MSGNDKERSNSRSRRSLLATVGTGIAATMAGCISSVTGGGSKELVVATYGGSFKEFMRSTVADPFEEEADENVTVKLVPYATLSKLRGMQEDPSIDVALLDDFDLIAGGSELFQTLSSEHVPLLDKQYDSAYLPGGYGVSHIFGSYGIAYSTDQWSASDFKSWKGLWNDEMNGSLAVQNNWPHFMIMGAQAWGGGARNMTPLWEKLPALSDNVEVFYEKFAAPEQLFNQDQISVSTWFNGRTYALLDSGVSVDYVIPKEGAVQVRGAAGVLKNSSVAVLGQQFVNKLLQPEVQKQMAQKLYYGPTTKDVSLSGDIAKKVTYQDDLQELFVPEWQYVNEHREQWSNKWQNNI